MEKLYLQFIAQATPQEIRQLTAKARRAGATEFRRLFPGDKDPETKRLFFATTPDPTQTSILLSVLERESIVAFVEPEAPRKLIKPILGICMRPPQ